MVITIAIETILTLISRHVDVGVGFEVLGEQVAQGVILFL
jgi:hypothetical protein